MKIGVIGCGYVFDTYMSTLRRHKNICVAGVADIDQERATKVGKIYGFRVYDTNDLLLANPEIELVLNLTSVNSHYEVTKAALAANKHVYSEKPFVTCMAQARELIEIAAKTGLIISGAPCNAMSSSVQTMWRAIRDGAVGKVRVVYAECDDNPIYLMQPETWRNPSGAPWPFLHEYEAGCTFEHAGYYLSWLAAMFGPAKSITAYSKCLVPEKTRAPLPQFDTPDFSVGCIEFECGVTARLTCSIVAPFDQRFRVIGDQGELSMNTYRDYECPVRLERFSALSLNARKARAVRESTFLQRLFGIRGRSVGLLKMPTATRPGERVGGPLRTLLKRQLGTQDKLLGVADMAAAIEEGRAPWITPEFLLHVTELTIALQGSGPSGITHELETRFEPLDPLPFTNSSEKGLLDLRPGALSRIAVRLAEPLLQRLHKH